ncbi:transcription factor cwo-like isoform X2 [Limulus polyphemus]|nr:transcription factor cwo-like isoform X2 [Limulus polyphemus]XP_022243355.1 transcription factor cwo-like isoform X2 [Limulus polyphemus]XP_022243356.1 transcription factor cwo-like isoform X2 [Limulus polyphemus]
MSHRIIEKRRRDRMNNCLADLSRLIPSAYLKKGRGRIEKTEIIEMAIRHLKHLQAHTCKDPDTCEVAKTSEQDRWRQYRLGFQECMSEVLHFMAKMEGLYAGDGFCVRLISYLQQHYCKVVGEMCQQSTELAPSLLSHEDSDTFPMEIEFLNSQTMELLPTIKVSSHQDLVEQESQAQNQSQSKTINDTPIEMTITSSTGLHIVNNSPSTSQGHNSVETVPISRVSDVSQLREMLQNPGLPIQQLPRSSTNFNLSISTAPSKTDNTFVNDSIATSTAGHLLPVLMHSNSLGLHRGGEEVYKFKKNIKERFAADLQQHGPSSLRASEDKVISYQEFLRHPSMVDTPSRYSPVSITNSCSSGQQSSPVSCAEENSVKIPEINTSENVPSSVRGWDNNTDSSNSCGFNLSPPSVVRYNGINNSSGYSIGNEMSYTAKTKCSNPSGPSSYTSEEDIVLCSSPQLPLIVPSIPIFALHPKGSFYIPLTMDLALLSPLITSLDENIPVLHPVSISVNFTFGQQLKIKEREDSSMGKNPH